MARARRWKRRLGALVMLTVLALGYHTMTTSWETVATTFMKSDKPYGAGAFRIHGNELMTLKIAGPELKFKPENELKDPDVAEFTEPWMNDVHQELNRTTVRFLYGKLDGSLTHAFEQPGQDAAWWYSKDWSKLYISTCWMDYTQPVSDNGLAPQITRLWHSVDGGKTWTQLHWPEYQNIGQLLFLDATRGYAVGWGPHVWRTADAGQSWQEIALPPLAADYRQPRKTFDAVNLGPDGMLRVAYYVGHMGEIQTSSIVYRLAWDRQVFEQDVVLPQQTVVDLQSPTTSSGAYSPYALSRLGPPRNWDDPNDNGQRTGAISTWTSYPQPKVEPLHTFDQHLTLEGLDVGKHGVLLVYATDATGGGAPSDYTLSSTDFGKTWDQTNDGMMQGSYFDPETNTQYALYAYTLKKRVF